MFRVYLEHGEAYGNLGDEAMLLCAVRRIRERLGDVEFVLPGYCSAPLPNIGPHTVVPSARTFISRLARGILPPRGLREWLDRIGVNLFPVLLSRLNRPLAALPAWQRIVGRLGDCDAVYVVGAANLNDLARYGCVLPKALLVREAHRLSKPVIVSSQTVGPLRMRWPRRLVLGIVTGSGFFSVRDEAVSVPTLASLGVGKAGFVFSGDEAFGLAPASREAATQFLRSQGVDPGERFALLHMRATDYTGTTERYYGSLAKALDMACVQSQVLFVPMSYWRHSGRDEQCGQAIRSRMERPERLRVLESVAHVALVRQIIAMSSWVLSLSYHLQVFALASARPFGILASGAYYLAKARGMSGLTGGLAPLLDLGAATPADLAQTMECLEHQDDSLISGLRLVGQRIARVNDAPVDALAGVVL